MTKRVEISFRMTDDWFEKSELVEKVVGRTPSGSGAGFGRRDMEWTLQEGEDARDLLLRIVKQCPFVDEIRIV